ncbi:MAG: molybdopterin-dependent oxidoreductase [Actinomycetota bacterium]|nr:molybdopterin-dependent oxidoreductase [Actinomycetota bacterium]
MLDKSEAISDPTKTWHKTACVLCSANCGLEVRLDDRTITRVRGNKDHVASKGYTCEKGLRINYYQNNTGRITTPLKRLEDGTYMEVDWDTAIEGVSKGLKSVAEKYGADKILYYGGGGQGNHLGGAHSTATRRAFGMVRRSNALAQEKTGEAWVEGLMFGTHTHGGFHDAEVAIFLGKNPWHSHGFDEARRVLKEISNSDERSLIVIDPRRTETADLADYWLQVRPGTDAFLLAAIGAVIVTEDLTDDAWLTTNTVGAESTKSIFSTVPIADYAERCGIPEDEIRTVARCIAAADSVSTYEDLGIEMGPNSTLISYLHRAISVLTANFGKPGALGPHTSVAPLFNYSAAGKEPTDPVTGGKIISGLVPCNEIADGFLSDHPERSRAMFIESGNPVHSLAGSEKFRQAMRAAECTVVIDVAMTETAEQADWVLPASSQYEKAEATFFAAGFPDNMFHLRPAILEPMEGTLSEPEIHSRLVQATGALDGIDFDALRNAAHEGLTSFSEAFMTAAGENKALSEYGAVVLYETLGKTLPWEKRGGAVLWFSCQMVAQKYPEQVRAAGHSGEGAELGNALFQAILDGEDGVIFSRHTHDQAFDLLTTPDQRIHLEIEEMHTALTELQNAPLGYTTEEFPYILAAGERRGFSANTIVRDPSWRKKDQEGALRIHPKDADELNIGDGERVRITTPGGQAVAIVEINETVLPGYVSLPNGYGLSYSPAGGNPEIVGVAPNELTSTEWRDPIAGTPWHKHVPAHLEAVAK